MPNEELSHRRAGAPEVKITRGTTVVVTGASSGVGRATARALGERAAKVGLMLAASTAYRRRATRSNSAATGR